MRLFLLCTISLSAVVENKIFCVHGGLSPTINTLDQVDGKISLPPLSLLILSEVSTKNELTDGDIYGRSGQLTGSKKCHMMAPCVTSYGLILKILLRVGD